MLTETVSVVDWFAAKVPDAPDGEVTVNQLPVELAAAFQLSVPPPVFVRVTV